MEFTAVAVVVITLFWVIIGVEDIGTDIEEVSNVVKTLLVDAELFKHSDFVQLTVMISIVGLVVVICVWVSILDWITLEHFVLLNWLDLCSMIVVPADWGVVTVEYVFVVVIVDLIIDESLDLIVGWPIDEHEMLELVTVLLNEGKWEVVTSIFDLLVVTIIIEDSDSIVIVALVVVVPDWERVFSVLGELIHVWWVHLTVSKVVVVIKVLELSIKILDDE